MLLSHRHPLLYKFAVSVHRAKRRFVWMKGDNRLARQYDVENKLPHNVKRHSTRLIKTLGDTDVRLQHNKVDNIKICLPFSRKANGCQRF